MHTTSRQQFIQGALVTLIVGICVGVFISWSNDRDALREASAQDYEDCMEERTGMSPSEYRNRYGYYPECY